MKLLSRLFNRERRKTGDPLFGSLELKGDWWWGSVAWPHGPEKIGITISRSPEPPNLQDQQAFVEVRDTYVKLLPRISEALFSLWGPVPPDAKWDGPRPQSPPELLALLQVDGAFIEPNGRVELLYRFAGDIWPDGMFTVAVEGQYVEAIAFDD